MQIIVLVLLLLVGTSGGLQAQCVNGRCGAGRSTPAWVPARAGQPTVNPAYFHAQPLAPVGRSSVSTSQQTLRYRWVKVPGFPDQEALLEYGKQIGSWSWSGGYYRSLNDGEWGPRVHQTPDGYWSRPATASSK